MIRILENIALIRSMVLSTPVALTKFLVSVHFETKLSAQWGFWTKIDRLKINRSISCDEKWGYSDNYMYILNESFRFIIFCLIIALGFIKGNPKLKIYTFSALFSIFSAYYPISILHNSGKNTF